MKRARFILYAGVVLLGACSGGDGSSPTPTSPTTTPSLLGLWQGTVTGASSLPGYRGFFRQAGQDEWIGYTLSQDQSTLYIQKGSYLSTQDSLKFSTDSVATLAIGSVSDVLPNMRKAVLLDPSLRFTSLTSATIRVWNYSLTKDTLVIQTTKHVKVAN